MISTGVSKAEVYRMQIEMAWRDERVNVFALSGVSMGIRLEPQLFVCKKRPIGHRGPFVLDPRKGRPRFQLSQLGATAQETANQTAYVLSSFEDLHDGYLALMRVSRLDAEVSEQVLEHGRSGANFIYYLDPPVTVQKLHPVLRPDLYERRKGDLMAFLSDHNWLLGEEGPTASGELETESLFDASELPERPVRRR